ncbi:MAG: glycosyltransferase family 4 protein [Gammaproteobacteria bacterium]|jgi:glycosyltransferase involved in cell wall biosynthesis|nr:glycosyltransferase family 4 protein [Gammaproteobacteria bacterium]
MSSRTRGRISSDPASKKSESNEGRVDHRPLITIVVHDLATNSFGRALRLSRMLAPEFAVEYLGFASGPTWAPAAGHGQVQHRAPTPDRRQYRSELRALARRARGDLVIACKPWPSVLALAGRAARQIGGPRILDIDDWELGWFYSPSRRTILSRAIGTIRDPNGLLRTACAEYQARCWPVRIASNRFLAARFSATLIPHGADTTVLQPASAAQRAAARARLGLDPDRVWLGFVGTPLRHKGIRVLVDALRGLEGDDVGLLIAGAARESSLVARLVDLAPGLVKTSPPFSVNELPDILAAIDLVCLPQLDLPFCRGQMPAKAYDAMAMAIPVVASAVCDFPEVLEGCGVLVPPGNVAAVGKAVASLVRDPHKRAELGRRGRDRCEREFSTGVVGARLREIVRQTLEGEGATDSLAG